jgi:hypothetical protein
VIIPPSYPAGVAPAPGLALEPTEVGALAGVRAVAGNAERQDEERASRDAGVIFEASAQLPPLEIYGPDGRRADAAQESAGGEETEESAPLEGSEETGETEGPQAASELNPKEQAQLDELRARDVEVRAHEAAHVAAGGPYVQGGATFSYETGPDGKQYAVGGEVGIDTAPVPDDPEATAQKARTVRPAAMAPASPSGADRAIAARASQMEAQAMADIATESRDEAQETGEQDQQAETDETGEAAGTPWDAYTQQPAEGATPASSFSLVA